jgi:hypothetical protein
VYVIILAVAMVAFAGVRPGKLQLLGISLRLLIFYMVVAIGGMYGCQLPVGICPVHVEICRWGMDSC